MQSRVLESGLGHRAQTSPRRGRLVHCQTAASDSKPPEGSVFSGPGLGHLAIQALAQGWLVFGLSQGSSQKHGEGVGKGEWKPPGRQQKQEK